MRWHHGRIKHMDAVYTWTDGSDPRFEVFYRKTEDYYSSIVGGLKNRTGFVKYNCSEAVSDVLIAEIDGKAVACAGLKKYSDEDVEIKRVWVEPDFRGQGLATKMMVLLEKRAEQMGYKRLILQTRSIMKDAVGLYERLGYQIIPNYPPYDKLEGAECMAKCITDL